MPVWTVHAPPSPGISAEPADDIILIREGFSWRALIFAPVWALAYGLWLAFALWLAAMIAISLLGFHFGPAVGWPLTIGFLIWFACEARDFRRAKLNRQDWRLVDVVNARTFKAAERRYFEKLAAEQAINQRDFSSAPVTLPPPQPGAFPTVIGYTT
jgi:hypothetical protein